MTLIELLLVVGMLGGFALGMSALVVRIQKEYQIVSQRIAQEVDAIDLSFSLKRYISGAVDLQYLPGDLTTYAVTNEDGRIRTYDLSGWAPTYGPGVAVPLAVFFRDELKTLQTPLPLNQQRFLPTGIFFAPPTIDHYGVVGFNLGDASVSGIDGRKIDLRFTNIVDFRIDLKDMTLFPEGGMQKVASFVVTFTKRVFTTQKGYVWCPPSKMSTEPLCQTESTYRDITRSVEVVLRNNALGFSSTRRTKELLNDPPLVGVPGAVTVFQPAVRRSIDGVYTLRPDTPIEAVRR